MHPHWTDAAAPTELRAHSIYIYMEHEPPLSNLYSALVDNHGAEQAQLPVTASFDGLVG